MGSLAGVTAEDEIDGDITDQLQVVEDAESFYSLQFPGKYTIKIRVVTQVMLQQMQPLP